MQPPASIIVSASISALPKTIFDPIPTVSVKLDTGESKVLFSYYPDEISFTEQEFVGLTEVQAVDLKYAKDLAYIKS